MLSEFIRIIFFIIFFSFVTIPANIVNAQNNDNLKTGIELYQSGAYGDCISILSDSKDKDKSTVQAYIVLSNIKLNTPTSVGLVKEYENNFPFSIYLTEIRFNLANLFFDEKNYTDALSYYDLIKKRNLSLDHKTEYDFRKAYCLMRIGSNTKAESIFKSIVNNGDQSGNSQYFYPASYYLGYLNYINKNFKEAIPYFENSLSDIRFSTLAQYHILESKFMIKDYDYVINHGGKIYMDIKTDYKPIVARLLSESYYAKGDHSKAKHYYDIYSVSSNNITKKDHFYAGMIAYSLSAYMSAIESFKKVASTTDSLGQSSFYHLGQSYIELKNKFAAQEAFKNAAASDFDKNIKEDAFFNYAKLSFDLNRDLSPFNEYLEIYPSSDAKWDEIHNYTSTSFLLNKNYDQAIESLTKLRRSTPQANLKLQKANFLRGMELVNAGSYTKAAGYFQKSIKYVSNNALSNLSQFWLAECYYRSDKFNDALITLNALLKTNSFKNSKEYPLSIYNRAYTKFKLGDFENAIADFNIYLSYPSSRNEFGSEAKLRMGDSYFMLKDYIQAAELFEKIAIEEDYKYLYAPLHSSIAYGLLGEDDKKSALLYEAIAKANTNSPLYTTTLYELGRTLVQNVKDEQASVVLEKLINNPKDSTYYYKALLEMGLINSNMQNHDKALEYYTTIVEKKPISEEAQSALAGIEGIYTRKNQPEEFLAYLDNIGMSTIKSADERETMLFNSAEQVFLGGNYTKALNSLTSFINKYPDGQYAPQANYYIAECYLKNGKPEQAADYFYKVMFSEDGAFTELSTLNYGKISYQLERYDEAIKAYETLSKIAILDNNKVEAQIGKMRSYFGDQQFEQAVIEANKVLEAKLADKAFIDEEANYIKAKSLLALGEREGANLILAILAKNPASEYGGEATYLLISDAYDEGDFIKVENMVFAFSDSKTPQAYWLAKSFITLGDSYAEQEDFEQAKATFKSIEDNYAPQKSDDIKDLVRMRLNKLK